MLRYKLIKKLHVSLQDIPVVFLYCDPLQFLQDVSLPFGVDFSVHPVFVFDHNLICDVKNESQFVW